MKQLEMEIARQIGSQEELSDNQVLDQCATTMAFGADELAKADLKLALRAVCVHMLGDAKAKYGPKIWL